MRQKVSSGVLYTFQSKMWYARSERWHMHVPNQALKQLPGSKRRSGGSSVQFVEKRWVELYMSSQGGDSRFIWTGSSIRLPT